jgi:hypothetical protein
VVVSFGGGLYYWRLGTVLSFYQEVELWRSEILSISTGLNRQNHLFC